MVAGAPTGPVEVPSLVRAFAAHIDDVVWQNEIGGYTFVAGDRFLKWNPLSSGAVTREWLDRPRDAVRAIAYGLRALHDKVPSSACPFRTRWVPVDAPGPADGAVVLHGDACAPNTIIGSDGRFAGHVDLGAVGVGDRWADLAIASMSLDWNYGEGWQRELFTAYDIEPDAERIRYYRAAWDGSA